MIIIKLLTDLLDLILKFINITKMIKYLKNFVQLIFFSVNYVFPVSSLPQKWNVHFKPFSKHLQGKDQIL